ncbi:MAG: ACP S-malonyltransferase [Planctomycetes bacterium]|nr:ACP S-malonyltransferase [Planctomycetota bacterium]
MSMNAIFLAPGQGAQAVGMGRSWHDASPAARAIFEEADRIARFDGGESLSKLCFDGPAERLNQTDVSQPALLVCGIACHAALVEQNGAIQIAGTLGLSLGEYTALALAGAFSWQDALKLVMIRGRLMQQAAVASRGSMVALIGADEAKANAVCAAAAQGQVLVPANFNAPGQIVLSGHAEACDRAVTEAGTLGLRASKLTVAGAFHSPLMAPAAQGMAKALAEISIAPLRCPVWSNVTGKPHQPKDAESVRKLLVDQLVQPVRWDACCADMIAWRKTAGLGETCKVHELAPGSVLRGLMRRIDKATEVTTHDSIPETQNAKN